ncbi:MAG: purine-nucleoside phosphorylase [Planctomycetaceae bacterium]|nr:purine-nucleoside phosphorylase [Planctomycetaceae bacterium]
MDADVESGRNFLASISPSVCHTAVILGSGLGAVATEAEARGGLVVDYSDIPAMPGTAVAGHQGRLVLGRGNLAGILFFQGRAHYYEGHPLSSVTFATRLSVALGISRLVVTNAAGGIAAGFTPGDLMLIDGHWSFLRTTETSAMPRQTISPRLWNAPLRELARGIRTPLNLHEGSYAMMSGPNYETPAEVRMLHHLGVSAVGMSTVPEAMAAARRGVNVLGVSCITNVASGLSDQPLDHAEVSETAGSIEAEFTAWMLTLLDSLPRD